MKTRREVLKASAATLAVGVPIAVVAGAQAPVIAVGEAVDGAFTVRDGDGTLVTGQTMYRFTFDFLVTGDHATARKVMDHFQSFIETSEGWPAKQTGINTSKITRV